MVRKIRGIVIKKKFTFEIGDVIFTKKSEALKRRKILDESARKGKLNLRHRILKSPSKKFIVRADSFKRKRR